MGARGKKRKSKGIGGRRGGETFGKRYKQKDKAERIIKQGKSANKEEEVK